MTGSTGRVRCEVDLHLHTVASDGDETPVELASRCVEAGLRVVAVTDHDSLDSVTVFTRAAGSALTVVPACEVSTRWLGEEAHCLGYWLSEKDTTFVARVRRIHDGELAWWREWVESVARVGVPLDWTDVVEQIGDDRVASPGDYIGLALAKAGEDERFRGYSTASTSGFVADWCAPGRPLHRPAPWAPDLVEAIGWITDAGGVAVLAHPARLLGDVNYWEHQLRILRREGLCGVEVWTTWHTPQESARLAELCAALDLVPTVGSDYHGVRVKPWATGPGLVPAAPEHPEAIVSALHERRSGWNGAR